MAETPERNSATALEADDGLAFSLVIPVSMIALVATSFVLSSVFHLAQVGLIAGLAERVLRFAAANSWGLAAFLACLIAQFFLESLAKAEERTRPVDFAGFWVLADLFGVASAWLACVWPYSGSQFQQIVFTLLLGGVCVSLSKCALTILALIAVRAP